MAGVWQAIWQWRDDRVRIATLQEQADHIRDEYAREIEAASRNPDEKQRLIGGMFSELDPVECEIAEIETRRRLASARKYGVPIPDRPEPMEDNEFWEWNLFTRHVLTARGHTHLRREVALEREIAWKPWLTWVALGVSVLSLAVSSLSAIFR